MGQQLKERVIFLSNQTSVTFSNVEQICVTSQHGEELDCLPVCSLLMIIGTSEKATGAGGSEVK